MTENKQAPALTSLEVRQLTTSIKGGGREITSKDCALMTVLELKELAKKLELFEAQYQQGAENHQAAYDRAAKRIKSLANQRELLASVLEEREGNANQAGASQPIRS